MTLVVVIASPPTNDVNAPEFGRYLRDFRTAPGEPCIVFDEDEAYYWFLWPLFDRLHADTGQLIDLYGNACFSGASLVLLREMLKEARKRVLAQPETWQVVIGQSRGPQGPQDIFAKATRTEFLQFLNDCEGLVIEAVETACAVIFWGD
jgi:hypothetical protein